MAIRLPIVGQDDGQWGTLLNSFLEVEHNTDGTLKKTSTINQAATDAATALTTANNAAATASAKYTKPAGGIPAGDLASGVQASLATADARDAAKLQGTAVDASTPSDGQVLVYASGSNSWVPNTATSTTVSDATGSTKGIVQLGGDLAGSGSTASAPQVVDASTTTKGKVQLAGDLAGTADSPSVAKVKGIAISGTAPTAGQVLTASDGTTAAWQTPAVSGVTSVAGRTGAVTLAESDIANLTTDLAAKAPLSSPTFTGTVTVPSPTNNTDAATKAYADSKATADATTLATGKVQLAGDLAGTATSPKVAKVNGVAITGSPTSGEVLTATSGTTATWQAASSGFADPTTTKGDLIVHGASTTRLAVGTNGQVLTADSTAATGVKWATPAAGAGSGYQYNFVVKNVNYTASNLDFVFINDVSAGKVTITLPAPVLNGYVSVKRFAPSGNAVEVAAPVGSFIDASGVGTSTLNSQYQSQDFLSDGTNWYRV